MCLALNPLELTLSFISEYKVEPTRLPYRELDLGS